MLPREVPPAGYHLERTARADGAFEDEPQNREGQPCWCPDAFLDNHLHVNYCPRHGRTPDPELVEQVAITEEIVDELIAEGR